MTYLFLLLASVVWARPASPPTLYPNPEAALQLYRSNLTRFRQERPNRRNLPELSFFLFGMGDRTKYIYRSGRLLNALTGNIDEQWAVKEEVIVPSEYLVHLVLTNGSIVQIREDETGVWVLTSEPANATHPATTGRAHRVSHTKTLVNLPRFADHAFGPVLRVLHQEILINIVTGADGIGRPVPNFLVYRKPWYRDATMMAMVLRETDNLHLIRDWIMALRDPFDRNNHGIAEADNPGQVLFLVSLVSDRNHPVVQMALDSVRQFEREHYIIGKTDYAEHPVFQTKWLKYGLKSLGLPDPYTIPKQYDSYSSLFWWDYTTEHVPGNRFDDGSSTNYPYLIWAEDHFYHEKRGIVGNLDYPLSWEQQASDAHYPGLTVLDPALVKQKLAFPHTWHAAEMFLLLNSQ